MSGYLPIESSDAPKSVDDSRKKNHVPTVVFLIILLVATFFAAELIVQLLYRNDSVAVNHEQAVVRSLQVSSGTFRPPMAGRLDCTKRTIVPSTTTPIDANQVRPADIAYIAAMGDSYMTGFTSYTSIENISNVDEMRNFVGNSFVMGGDGELGTHLTLANIFRHLNPSLRGFSTGVGLQEAQTNLNVALTGMWADDMPRQARELIRRFHRLYPATSVENDWKLINIYIGTRDISGMCLGQGGTDKREYKRNLTEAIAVLQQALPKSIISIIGVANLNFMFGAAQIVNGGEMPCTLKDFSSLAQRRIEEYREVIVEIVADQSPSRTDQVVIALHVFDDLWEPLRKPDGSYDTAFYAQDTFHLSNYGNSLVAKQLWNQMVSPDHRKYTNNQMMADENQALLCPEIRCPFIRTPANSLHCVMTEENILAGIV